jgi:hypothetical protein
MSSIWIIRLKLLSLETGNSFAILRNSFEINSLSGVGNTDHWK